MELKQAEEIIKAELLRGENALAEKGHTYAHTRVIERGCARFWAKRGGNPEPNWRAASKRDWKTRHGMEDEEV